MFEEHDRGVLMDNMALKAGDVGTIVHIYPHAAAFEIEFLALDSSTAGFVTVGASQMRPPARTNITHAREIRING